jgi:hypothetical protein
MNGLPSVAPPRERSRFWAPAGQVLVPLTKRQ